MAAKPSGMASIHWFRKGLRIHDNPALLKALQESHSVYPLFIFDPHFVKSGKVGGRRYSFLLESLRDLDETLRKKYSSRLFVARGNPLEVLPKLVERWDVKKLTFEVDTEPYASSRDAAVKSMFASHPGFQIETASSHTLWDIDETLARFKGKPPLSYQSFVKVVAHLPLAPQAESPLQIPTDLSTFSEAEFGVPSLDEIGLSPLSPPPKFVGGEHEALARLSAFIDERAPWVRAFEKPSTSPNTLEASTTVLSPYLKFGCLSARHFLRELRRVCSGKPHSAPPVSLEGQLLWREFFYTVGRGTPNFDKMAGNPICRQIPWDRNDALLAAWRDGTTGFPFIDAIMIQLRDEGWIHHLARHATACFLTRGDLWQSWEAGAAVFEERLLDADWALNSANWMWLSCSCFFYQYFRCYSPIAFGKKTDPNGDYIRKYLPQLRRLPAKYIYEPWTAPKDVQQACGCVVGRDYPKPIVDHAVVSKANMERMKAAYAQHESPSHPQLPLLASSDAEAAPSSDAPEAQESIAKKLKTQPSSRGDTGKGRSSQGQSVGKAAGRGKGKGDGRQAKLTGFLGIPSSDQSL